MYKPNGILCGRTTVATENNEASGVHEFSTIDIEGHLQFNPKLSNLTSYAHGQLRLEQAKLAIA
jgi:hypothetical protein